MTGLSQLHINFLRFPTFWNCCLHLGGGGLARNKAADSAGRPKNDTEKGKTMKDLKREARGTDETDFKEKATK